jgi:hypothetical protein
MVYIIFTRYLARARSFEKKLYGIRRRGVLMGPGEKDDWSTNSTDARHS